MSNKSIVYTKENCSKEQFEKLKKEIEGCFYQITGVKYLMYRPTSINKNLKLKGKIVDFGFDKPITLEKKDSNEIIKLENVKSVTVKDGILDICVGDSVGLTGYTLVKEK